jgi:hypothetical protein
MEKGQDVSRIFIAVASDGLSVSGTENPGPAMGLVLAKSL